MIEKMDPLSMPEALKYVKKSKYERGDIVAFIKKFTKLNPKDALDLRKKIRKLDLMKVNEKHISKIINIMPKETEDLNKIFIDVGLDEDEAKKILETVEQFK